MVLIEEVAEGGGAPGGAPVPEAGQASAGADEHPAADTAAEDWVEVSHGDAAASPRAGEGEHGDLDQSEEGEQEDPAESAVSWRFLVLGATLSSSEV